MISNQDKLKIENYLQSKVPNFKCPACSAMNFTKQEVFYMDLAVDALDNIAKGKPFAYLKKFAVTCNNCSHISYFSAQQIGV